MKTLCITEHSDRPEAETFIGLKNKGVDISVICPNSAPHFQRLIDNGINVIDYRFKGYLPAVISKLDILINDKKVGCDQLDIYDGQFYNGKEMLLKHLLHETELTGSINVVMFRVDTLRSLPGHPHIFKPGVYHIDSDLAYEIMNISDLGFVFQVLSYTRRHNETYTSLISHRFKTYLYFRERQLYLYKELDQRLEKSYRRVRRSYAMFLIRQWFKRDKECIAWHNKHLDRERYFTMVDYMKALLSRIF